MEKLTTAADNNGSKRTSENIKNSVSARITNVLWNKIKKPIYVGVGAIAIGTAVFLGTKNKDTTHIKSIDTTFGELVPIKDRTLEILLGDKTISFEDEIKIKGEHGLTFFGKKIASDIFGSLDDVDRKLLIEGLVEFGYKYEYLEKLPIHIIDSTMEKSGNHEKRRLIEMNDISAPDTLKIIFTDKCKVEDKDERYNLSLFQDDEFIKKAVDSLKFKTGKQKLYKQFSRDMQVNGEEYRLLAVKKLWQMMVKLPSIVEGPNKPDKTMLVVTFMMNGKKYIMSTTDGEIFNTTIDTMPSFDPELHK